MRRDGAGFPADRAPDLAHAVQPVDLLAVHEVRLVHHADRVHRIARDEDAGTRDPLHALCATKVDTPAVERIERPAARGEPTQVQELGRIAPDRRESAHRTLRGSVDVLQARRDGGHGPGGLRVEAVEHGSQRAGVQVGIGVEEQERASGGDGHAGVVAGCHAAVATGLEHLDGGIPLPDVADGVVGRGVVDHDQLEVHALAPGAEDGVEAGIDVVERVPRHDDDGDIRSHRVHPRGWVVAGRSGTRTAIPQDQARWRAQGFPCKRRCRAQMAPSPTGLTDAPTASDADSVVLERRPSRLPFAAALVLIAAASSIYFFAARDLIGPDLVAPLGMIALVVPTLLASWLALGVSRRKDLSKRDVTGWVFVGLAAGAASVFSLVVLLPTGAATGGATPLIGGVAHIAMLLFASVGVLHWVRRLSPSATLGTVLDLACVAVLAYVVSWRTILSSALLGTADVEGTIDRISNLATPALSTLLLVAVVTVLSQVGREDIRGSELLATFGFGGMVATDLGMALKGVGNGGFDDAWHDTVLGSGPLPIVALGWLLGIAAVGFGASLRRVAPASDAHLPLMERSTTWELLVSLVPFAMLGGVLATTSATREGEGIASSALLAVLGTILLLRCTLVAVSAIRSARTSDTDHLTHALSHRMFQERVPLEVERANSAGKPVALIVFDIDDFGLLNDSYSHAEGDRYLQEVAWVIRRSLRRAAVQKWRRRVRDPRARRGQGDRASAGGAHLAGDQ